jgi:hypothetical protein
MSFVADPELAAKVKEAARIDGVSQSQAAARAVASGVLLSAGARRNLRFALEEGGVDAQRALATELSRAVVQVANDVLTRKLMERARLKGGEPPSEDDIQEEANAAVRRHMGITETPADEWEALGLAD